MTNTECVVIFDLKKTEVKVTVLPPGEALGARDTLHWSLRRMNGQSGVPRGRKKYKQPGKNW